MGIIDIQYPKHLLTDVVGTDVLIDLPIISKPLSSYLLSFFFRFTTKPQFTVYRVLQQIDWVQ